jgi:hypothetical protein
MAEVERKVIKISEIRKFVVDKVSKIEDDIQLCRVFEILSGNTVTHAGELGSEEVEVMIHKRF